MSHGQPDEPDPSTRRLPPAVPPGPHGEPTEIAHPQERPSFVKDTGDGAPSVPPVPPPPMHGEPRPAGPGPNPPQSPPYAAPQPPPGYGSPQPPPPYGGPVPQPHGYGPQPPYGAPQPPPPQPPYGQPGMPGGAWPSGQSAAGWPGTAPFTHPGYGAPPPGGGTRRALIVGIVAAVVAIAAVVVSVVLLTGDDGGDPVASATTPAPQRTTARPTPTGPIPGTSRPPTSVPSATGSDTVRKMNRGDCLDTTLTADGHLPLSAGMVACDAGNAVVKITSAIKKSSGRTIAECAKTEGSTGWDIPEDPDNFYCVERVYHAGECFPASDAAQQLALVVPCSSSAPAGGRVLRITQVLDSPSATCALDYAPISLTTRQLLLCTEPAR